MRRPQQPTLKAGAFSCAFFRIFFRTFFRIFFRRGAALFTLWLLTQSALAASEEVAEEPPASSSGNAAAAQRDDTSPLNSGTQILNYVAYSDRFASAGQPTAEQLAASQANGVERVIYLAFSDQKRSLPAEDRTVKELGMSYLQIPVDWKAPQKRDYYLFAQAMSIEPERKTLLHCQANFRASAFAMLYRVLELKVPLADAKADMNKAWVPNATWTKFIVDILEDNNIDPNCEGCDWTPSTIGD